MELMYEPEVVETLNLYDVLWLSSEDSSFNKLLSSFEKINLKSQWLSISDATKNFSELKPRVIVCELDLDSFKNGFACLDKIKGLSQASAIIIIFKKLENVHIHKLVNQLGVFAVLSPRENLIEYVKKAIEDFKDKSTYFNNIKKIKLQNEKLESLNKNLEKVVHERTKKEFEANQMTVSSLKDIQGILKFIKAISRAETIEELMNEVRGDFKRFHGLMPPILIFLESSSLVRVFYFQGKQFTEKTKTFTDDKQPFRKDDDNSLRGDLSNFFGRPFGAVSVTDLNFRPQELQSIVSKVVCEHSFNAKSLGDFDRYSSERWSIINMALENILLKEKTHEIAKQWSKTFNEMKDPIVILDQNYKKTLSNSSFHKKLEAEYGPLLSQGEGSPMNSSIHKTFLEGLSQIADIHLSGKIYRVHSYPIRLEREGKVSHVINQYVDMTQSIDLQSKVVQGEKMAAVGLLAGNIAHELNNPLTGIHSLSGLILDDLDKETNSYKDLVEVRDAAARCQRIIKDLLEFSSVGSDSTTGIVSINQIISKTLTLLKMAMRTHNCEIILAEEELKVECNPQLLQQVIFNIVNNACQAMEDGGKLRVESKTVDGKVQILISDTGPGIPSDVKKFIFDPFFTTKDEGEGTGLGLSMSLSVVERFGGTLTLSEEREVGSEFVISLPRV